jgi:hypothetical protein
LSSLEKYGGGDPATGKPIGTMEQNLEAAIAGETYEYTEMYPGFAKIAREEGFDDIAGSGLRPSQGQRSPTQEGSKRHWKASNPKHPKGTLAVPPSNTLKER